MVLTDPCLQNILSATIQTKCLSATKMRFVLRHATSMWLNNARMRGIVPRPSIKNSVRSRLTKTCQALIDQGKTYQSDVTNDSGVCVRSVRRFCAITKRKGADLEGKCTVHNGR